MGSIDNKKHIEFSRIISDEVQEFININLTSDLYKLLFSHDFINKVSIKDIINQIESKRKSLKKLPTWFNTRKIIYHEKLNIEQSSSEKTALYKSLLFKGNKAIDLTCGFGVDSYYFSKRFASITLCDQNTDLLNKVEYNYNILGISNAQFYNGNGIDYLKSNLNNYDLIYIDPARRNKSNKVFLLEDCTPDILEIQTLLLKKSKNTLIKLSPLFDIKELTRKLKNIKSIYIIALKSDVKELLVELEVNYEENISIICENLETNQNQFKFDLNEHKTKANYTNTIKQYLYEPNPSILKSGAFNLISTRFGIDKLDHNTHLYSSDKFIKLFPGKIFKIIKKISSQSKNLKKELNNSHYNIISRNHPLKVEEIKRKYKLKEGGDKFLIFTQINSKKIILLLEKFN